MLRFIIYNLFLNSLTVYFYMSYNISLARYVLVLINAIIFSLVTNINSAKEREKDGSTFAFPRSFSLFMLASLAHEKKEEEGKAETRLKTMRRARAVLMKNPTRKRERERKKSQAQQHIQIDQSCMKRLKLNALIRSY